MILLALVGKLIGKASHTLWLAPSGSTNFLRDESVGEAFFYGL